MPFGPKNSGSVYARYVDMLLQRIRTKLFTESTKYLGFDVSQKEISMRKSFVERVLEWPRPKTTLQLRTFMGLPVIIEAS